MEDEDNNRAEDSILTKSGIEEDPQPSDFNVLMMITGCIIV